MWNRMAKLLTFKEGVFKTVKRESLAFTASYKFLKNNWLLTFLAKSFNKEKTAYLDKSESSLSLIKLNLESIKAIRCEALIPCSIFQLEFDVPKNCGSKDSKNLI